MKIIRFIELFAGIGGFRYGLEKANDTIIKRTQQGIQQRSKSDPTINEPLLGAEQFNCVWSNEWDRYACQIYRKNYGEGELQEGDIRGIPAEVIPDHELLTAGFPCQAFSIAGRRRGFEDTRGTLFFEICRIAEVKKPRLLLLENVKGLLNHQKGETFRIILNTLSELGYDCEWQVHNSKNFGVPQNRERVFIIGYYREKGRRKIFPLQEDDGIFNKEDEPNQRLSQARYSRTKALTTKTRAENTFIIQNKRKIRRLTPTEYERLQGFPDGWTEGLSDSQRYKCLGNAVTTNVITEIGKAILKGKEGGEWR